MGHYRQHVATCMAVSRKHTIAKTGNAVDRETVGLVVALLSCASSVGLASATTRLSGIIYILSKLGQ